MNANDGTFYGHEDGHRTSEPRPRMRQRCWCGCRGRKTHTGMADGVALMYGCEWLVRLWVRDPTSIDALAADWLTP